MNKQQAERDFLDASIAVWREIDRLMLLGPYPGIPMAANLRISEKLAWERYRQFLNAEVTAEPVPAGPRSATTVYERLEEGEVYDDWGHPSEPPDELKKLAGALQNEIDDGASLAQQFRTILEHMSRAYALGAATLREQLAVAERDRDRARKERDEEALDAAKRYDSSVQYLQDQGQMYCERMVKAEAALLSAQKEIERLLGIIMWALGENGEFKERGEGGPYWFRIEMRNRLEARAALAQEKIK